METLSAEQLSELKRLMEADGLSFHPDGSNVLIKLRERSVGVAEQVAAIILTPILEALPALIAAAERDWASRTSMKDGPAKEQQIRDAERYQVLKAGFGVMSVKMDSNHHWIWRHHPKLVGPTIDAAVDSAIKDTQ